MLDVEKNVRIAIFELFHVVRMNAYMRKAQAELNELLGNSEYSLRMFERSSGSDKLSDAKEYFEMLIGKVKNSYGTDAVSKAYNCFKIALDEEEYYKPLGLTEVLSPNDKSALFRQAFDKIVLASEHWDCELDCYSFFIENVKEILMPTNEKNTDVEEICPYCDGIPQRMQKSDFFGPHSGEGEGHIWGCECGAYALMDDNGKVIGKLGDAILHQKRNLVKRAICELCSLAGLTCFESYRWFSLITNTHLEEMSDVEYLDLDACNLALRLFINAKAAITGNVFDYPKDRSELFLFFMDGGRLSVCNAYGFQYGKILVPSEIGTDGIKVYGKDGSQSISFSANLKYEFKDDCMYIVHPSGKKEKFRMLPAGIRNMLFNSELQEAAAMKAG